MLNNILLLMSSEAIQERPKEIRKKIMGAVKGRLIYVLFLRLAKAADMLARAKIKSGRSILTLKGKAKMATYMYKHNTLKANMPFAVVR